MTGPGAAGRTGPETPLTWVLIPGAGGSAWYWHLVERELRDAGHEVVAVDLPADDDRAGLPEYADATIAAVTRHRALAGDSVPREDGGREERVAGAPARPGAVVLVAASLGGFTAPLVCQRLPVSLLVLVNAMIPTPGETPGDWWSATGQDAARRAADLAAGRPPDAEFDPGTYFFHDVEPRLFEQGAAYERDQSATVFGSPLTVDAWPRVPTRVLVGRDDRFFPPDLQRRVARERLGLVADEIRGGHLVALSNPVELTGRLLAYAAQDVRDAERTAAG